MIGWQHFLEQVEENIDKAIVNKEYGSVWFMKKLKKPFEAHRYHKTKFKWIYVKKSRSNEILDRKIE